MDDRTDEIVRWCNAHGVTMKGHPLAWNYVDPRWLAEHAGRGDAASVRAGRRSASSDSRASINIWDVVNEATAYDREELKKQCAEADRGDRQDGHRRVRPDGLHRLPARRIRRRRS